MVTAATPAKGSRSASPISRSATPTKAGSRSATPTKAGASTPAKKAPAAAAPAKGGAAMKKRPPQPPKEGDFVASKKFDGPRTGMVFRSGSHGVGYYKDTAGGYSGQSTPADSPASAATSERELDAAEVFALLPLSMQVAFEARDINALDAALSAMPPAEAEVCMQRCISSGLWDPNGAGGGAAEQEPSPTGDSEQPGSAAPSPEKPDVAEEEAAASAEARALEERAAAAAEGGGSGSDQLFERGPYRAGGGAAASDAPKRGSAAAAKSAKAAEPAAEPASAKKGAAAKAGGGAQAAAGSSKAGGARGGSQVAVLQHELESAQHTLRMEQAGRAAAEAELDKANVQVQRLLTKLDEAEKFKSDEAKAISASRDLQKRLADENDQLRRLLAEAKGTSVDEIASSIGAPPASDAADGKAADGGAAGANPSSAFDAPIESDPDKIVELNFPPASLDPDVVLQTLPKTMQDAFDALDVAALHAALAALPPAESSEYMRRCVASGLWDPNGAGGGADAS